MGIFFAKFERSILIPQQNAYKIVTFTTKLFGMTIEEIKAAISAGIPSTIPSKKDYDPTINHAPKRKEILSKEETKLALQNALRYFPKEQHAELAKEFVDELKTYGRIYMYRYRPDYKMYARPIY